MCLEHTRAVERDEGENVRVGFGIEVLDARHNASAMIGLRLEADMCNFQWLALNTWPDSDLEGWV